MKYQLHANVRWQRTVWQVVILSLLLVMSGLAMAQNEPQPKAAEEYFKRENTGTILIPAPAGQTGQTAESTRNGDGAKFEGCKPNTPVVGEDYKLNVVQCEFRGEVTLPPFTRYSALPGKELLVIRIEGVPPFEGAAVALETPSGQVLSTDKINLTINLFPARTAINPYTPENPTGTQPSPTIVRVDKFLKLDGKSDGDAKAIGADVWLVASVPKNGQPIIVRFPRSQDAIKVTAVDRK